MASIKEIRNHMKSISDTRKITNAMYLISSTKFRSAKSLIAGTEEYCNLLTEQMKNIASSAAIADNPLTHPGKGGKKAFLVIASDKGLAGEYSKNIIKKAVSEIEGCPGCRVFIIGDKAKKYFDLHKVGYEKDFDHHIKSPDSALACTLSEYFRSLFLDGEISSLDVIAARMVNPIKTEVEVTKYLPLDFHGETDGSETEFLPDARSVAGKLIPLYLNYTLYRIIAESFCSEQNARMTAMDAANSNAGEILDRLTLEYNHTRQNAITREITEISSERTHK